MDTKRVLKAVGFGVAFALLRVFFGDVEDQVELVMAFGIGFGVAYAFERFLPGWL